MDRARSDDERALGSLVFSRLAPNGALGSRRALEWVRELDKLGVRLPFFVTHDLGLALVAGADEVTRGPRLSGGHAAAMRRAAHAPSEESLERYQGLLDEVRLSAVASRARRLALGDRLVAVVLARLCGEVARACSADATRDVRSPGPNLALERGSESDLVRAALAHDRRFEAEFLQRLLDDRLAVLARLDALDVDTLQLFGLSGESEWGAASHVDMLSSLTRSGSHDIVNFSLELLPSVLETRPRPGASSVAAHGFAGLGLRGSIDNLVLTELAWDDEHLARRMLDGEVLYYAREEERTEDKASHLLLIDASASMRGERSTFARALALATGKKLALAGDEVAFRFFDSRLYEPHLARRGAMPTGALLAFRGERGRNPTRVWRELQLALDLKPRADVTVHVFTHGGLYVPRPLVAEIRRRARIVGIFILPSLGRLDLDYLDLLERHWVVDHESLDHAKRGAAARRILHGTRA